MRMTSKFVSKAGLKGCKTNLISCGAGQNNCEACLRNLEILFEAEYSTHALLNWPKF